MTVDYRRSDDNHSVVPEMIGTVLVVTGVLTLAAGVGFLAPRRLLEILLGETAGDATVILMTRHWSLLVALVGALLIYAGGHPETRVPVMIVAAIEKLALGALVFASPLRRRPLTVAVVSADAVMACFFIYFLTQ